MEIRVTTRDGNSYVVDTSSPENAPTVFLEASDEEWVRVISEKSGTKGTFVRRSEVKFVEFIDEDDSGPPGEIF